MGNRIFRPKILHRKRVEDILLQVFEVPVSFISASMGYGKTTAVRNFLKNKKKVDTIWLGVAYEEDDGIWIWHKLCNSIRNVNLKLCERLLEYGCPKSKVDFYKVLSIIREEIKQKTIVVIDDWYDIKTAEFNNLIKIIVYEEIPDLHVVIMSRNKPGDQYLEFELKQRCLIMKQEDLEFTFDETVEFFEINGIKLTQKEKEVLHLYCEGWTAAVYLSLHQYKSTKTLINNIKIHEIIKNAVFSKFDDATRSILFKLSFMDNFTLEQAVYITEDINTKNVINELVSNNCFIKYNEKYKKYTLHTILRNVLQEEVIQSNIEPNEIYNICGDWYFINTADLEAIAYYYKGKNYNKILDLMERNKSVDLLKVWRNIIIPMFDELSMEEKVNRPIAYLIYLLLYILYENTKEGKELLYDLWVIYRVNEDLEGRSQVLGEIAFLESVLEINDVKKMTKCHQKAYELFEGGTSKIANNKMPITFGSPHLLSLYHKEKGEFKNLVEHLKNELHYFIQISNDCGFGIEYLISAEYLFEIGDVHNSELFAYKALYKAKLKNQTSIIICSLFLLMRIYINKDEWHKFRSKYKKLTEEYINLDIPSSLNGTEIALRYIDGITGNLDHEYKCDKEKEGLVNLLMLTPSPNIDISALEMVLKGSYIELEIHVEVMLGIYYRKNNIFGIINAYIFDAIAKYNLYSIEDAKKSLLKAIELAKEDHIIMSFIELAPHMLPILEGLKEVSEYIKMILPRCKRFNEIYIRNNCYSGKLELTPRELEVIKLVDEGYKQVEISDKLNIALVTVKKHIASVYDKLDVKSKIVAINLLKEKGII